MSGRENIEIGLRIKKIRKAMGISQMQLAESLGVSFQQIQKYESGVNSVSLEKLKKVAAALKSPLLYFIGEENGHKKGYMKEEEVGYGKVSFEELSTEEIQLLMRLRSVKSETIKKGINLLLMGIEQVERQRL